MNDYLYLKRRVMARIYVEHIKDVFVERMDYFMFSVFIVVSFISVSMYDVLNNIPKSDFSAVFNFFVIALKNTNWIIQALIAGFLARVAIYSAKFAYKNISPNLILTKFKLRY